MTINSENYEQPILAYLLALNLYKNIPDCEFSDEQECIRFKKDKKTNTIKTTRSLGVNKKVKITESEQITESKKIVEMIFDKFHFIETISITRSYVVFNSKELFTEKTNQVMPDIYFIFKSEMPIISFSVSLITTNPSHLTGHQKLAIREKSSLAIENKLTPLLEWVLHEVLKNKKIPFSEILEEMFMSKYSLVQQTNLSEGLGMPAQEFRSIREHYSSKENP